MSERHELLDVIRGIWTADQAAFALGLAESDLNDWCRRGDLLGLPTADGDLMFPGWQFDCHADGTVHAGTARSRSARPGIDRPTGLVDRGRVRDAGTGVGRPVTHRLDPVWSRRDAEVLTWLGEQVRREWR